MNPILQRHVLTNFQVLDPLAAFQNYAGRLMAKNTVALDNKGSNASGLPEMNIGAVKISMMRRKSAKSSSRSSDTHPQIPVAFM